MRLRLVLMISACFIACARPTAAEERVDFNRDIRSLISNNCLACHGPDEEERAADLRLDTQAGSRADLGGYAAVVPGEPDESELLSRITSDDDDERMPPVGKGAPLTKDQVALVRRWIEQGAEYQKHWSYEPPVRPEVPAVKDAAFSVRNPIDAFVLRKLNKSGLKPSPAADRFALARRVAMDLTGLPPTWEEAQAFAKDDRADAYERYVDAQLKKPAFGERWARVWLDLARYADSAGYADDPPRTIWAYRDWVIRALNENKPFDAFTVEQIAGDLLDNPADDQLIATAFHRNTLTNNEGGTNNEEFRNVAVVDRVNTTMEVWMGTTMACAQCHTHKFDPITQVEYFQLFDFFNQSQDADERDERPTLDVWANEDDLERKKQLESKVAELEQTLAMDTPAIEASRSKWLKQVQSPLQWQPLTMSKADGAKLKKDGDGGWIAIDGGNPEKADYRLEFPTEESDLRAIRLEVAKEQTSNFVLSKVTASWTPTESQPASGQYVRIELPGKEKFLHLAEVEVLSGGSNVATEGTAAQSTTDYGGDAKRAIDGKTDGIFGNGSVSHTGREENPWFEIDLGSVLPIDEVVIWNRADDLESRLKGYQIRILDADRKEVWAQSPEDVPAPNSPFPISGAQPLKFALATADFEQGGFPASSVLTDKKGWAIGGRTGKPHELNLILSDAMQLRKGALAIVLSQQSAHPQHTLSRFRLLSTDDANASELARLPVDIRPLVQKKDRDEKEESKVAKYYRTIADELAGPRTELAKINKQISEIKPATTVPIMRDLAGGKPRITKVQVRGNYKSTNEEVTRATPAVFHPLRNDLPKNRLALAEWLVDDANPLTARVTVNRFWEQIFGIGIVETNEEFGSQGEMPTHPELLDWLALEFRSDWDVKRLLKTLVMSSTYRQQSNATPERLEVDPRNQLYARGPRFRVSAEMVRDQVLFVSGLLSQKMYGPPVKPRQPNLGLNAAFGSSTDWKSSDGEDQYRRGLYTTWRRSNPYPSMATFDAPNREVCTSRRSRTNTPLQALVTLNDPVYIEAAQALSRRLDSEGGDSPEAKVGFGIRTCLMREPTKAEVAELVALYESMAKEFEQNPGRAKQMATEPIGDIPEGADGVKLAAWTVVSNVILNLDEMFLKR